MKKAVGAVKGATQIIWLAVAALVGVGLLAWVGSMFLPGDDADPAEVVVSGEPEPEPEPVEPSEPPVPVVDRGSWIMVEDQDPMNDSPQVVTGLEEDGATLYVGCVDGRTNVLIRWDEYLGMDTAVTVTHRLPPKPAERGSWLRGGESTVAPDPIALLRGMVAGTELVVRTTPYMSGQVTVTFDLTGAREAVGKVAEACGWEL